jgi:hypothetical protein
MSLFSWLSPRKKPVPMPDSSGLSRMESTKPYSPRGSAAASGSNAQPANRKNERMARRELLYGVVRESMTNAGVLSTSYKFKVLSLDARGRQFLVMVDLASEFGGETHRLAEIEAMVAQAAKARFDILVTAVYWRMNEHVAVGVPASARGATPSRPVPLDSGPAPLAAAPAVKPLAEKPAADKPVLPQSHPSSRFEPLHPDEVSAFKRALASGASGAEAMATAATAAGASAKSFDGAAKHGPQSYTLLTGFEDTEMADSDAPPAALSTTQYGDLR